MQRPAIAFLALVALALPATASAESGDEVYAIPVDRSSPHRGPRHAKVTIVTYGDYGDPYSMKLAPVLDELRARHPGEVKVVYKSFALAHLRSGEAAIASCAAHKAGKWDQLDRLLWERASPERRFDAGHIADLARAAGLPERRLRRHRRACERQIDAEQAEGKRFGVTGVPTTFVNGRKLMGARPIEAFDTLITEELARANRAISRGTRLRDYYARHVVARGKKRAEPRRPAAGSRPPLRGPDAAEVYSIPVAGDPAIGPADALVTVVVGWELFEPFSRKIRGTLADLGNRHRRSIRIVFKHNVVLGDRNVPAHRAACAAHRQGRYTDYVDALWSRVAGRDYDEALLRGIAAELGLDLEAFDRDRVACDADIDRDRALYSKLGVTGTPVSFVNGRFLRGAQPAASFDVLITDELRRAKKRVRRGTRPADYYRIHVIEAGKTRL